MWGDVNPELGEAREAELKADDDFFKPALDEGAKITRHDNSSPSAERIIRLLLDQESLPLCIQRELVDEKKEITDTSAGQELNRDLNEQMEKHKREIQELRNEIKQAIGDKDEKSRRELENQVRRMLEVIEGLRKDVERLASDYKKEKARLEVLMKQKELDAAEEMARIEARHQKEIERLTHPDTIPTARHQRGPKKGIIVRMLYKNLRRK